MIRVQEVYEKQIQQETEKPDGSVFINFSKIYDARQALLNPTYIVSVHPHEFGSSIDQAKLEKNFAANTKFCTLVLDGNSFRTSEVVVVGSFDHFARKLGTAQS